MWRTISRPANRSPSCRVLRRSAMCAIRPPAAQACATCSRCSPTSRAVASAVAHNGNISNAHHVRRDLVERGAIFQSTSDTEVIIHLVATSRFKSMLDKLVDALRLVEGAYALVVMTPRGMAAVRDPLGIRPLVMGRLGDATVFASETVALDVVGAEFVRQIEPGEFVEVDFDGTMRSHRPFGDISPRPCIFEHVYFSRPDLDLQRPLGLRIAQDDRRRAGQGSPGRGRPRGPRCPTAAYPRRSATRSSRAFRSSSASSVRTTSGAPSSSPRTARGTRGQAQAQRQPQARRGQAHRADRRSDRPRHHLDEDRADDARCRRERSPFPRRQPADRTRLLLRRRHSRALETARGTHGRGRDVRVHPRRQPGVRVDRTALSCGRLARARQCLPAILRRLLHRRLSDAADRPRRAPPDRRAALLSRSTRSPDGRRGGGFARGTHRARHRREPRDRRGDRRDAGRGGRACRPDRSHRARSRSGGGSDPPGRRNCDDRADGPDRDRCDRPPGRRGSRTVGAPRHSGDQRGATCRR